MNILGRSWLILGDSFEQGNGILSITQKLNFVENIFQKLNNFEIGEYSINFFAISVLWLGGKAVDSIGIENLSCHAALLYRACRQDVVAA